MSVFLFVINDIFIVFEDCKDFFRQINITDCAGNLTAYSNGTCYNKITGQFHGIYNKSVAEKGGIRGRLPAEDYLR